LDRVSAEGVIKSFVVIPPRHLFSSQLIFL
jgi:hypothetical protein